jgi:hypothetical protein
MNGADTERGAVRSPDSLAPKSRARAVSARVEKLIEDIKEIRNETYKSKQLLIKRTLSWSDYSQLLHIIESLEDKTL